MNDARQFISGKGGNCSHRALHGKRKNQQVCWSTCVCFLWVYMCFPLHLCICVSIRNEGPARANERCWETVIETLRRAGDGIWARWSHSKRKKTYSLCSFICTTDLGSMFFWRTQQKGESLLSLFTIHFIKSQQHCQKIKNKRAKHKKQKLDLDKQFGLLLCQHIM